MILAVLPCRPGEPAPLRLPAPLVPLLGSGARSVLLLARGELAAGSDSRPLAMMVARAGQRPDAFAAGLLSAPPDRMLLLHLAGLSPAEAAATVRAAGAMLARRQPQPPALLVACQDEDVATLAEALADACLVRATGLSDADRQRVAGRIRRRAALLRWFGPLAPLRGGLGALRRLRARLRA